VSPVVLIIDDEFRLEGPARSAPEPVLANSPDSAERDVAIALQRVSAKRELTADAADWSVGQGHAGAKMTPMANQTG
jgi:hypothetical protein